MPVPILHSLEIQPLNKATVGGSFFGGLSYGDSGSLARVTPCSLLVLNLRSVFILGYQKSNEMKCLATLRQNNRAKAIFSEIQSQSCE